MKKNREILLTVTGAGDVKLEGVNFSGRECDMFMEPIEKALAGTGKVDKNYDERRQSAETDQTIAQRW